MLRVLGLDETELGILFCLIMFCILFMPRREEPIVVLSLQKMERIGESLGVDFQQF
jgi:hypothetical protein